MLHASYAYVCLDPFLAALTSAMARGCSFPPESLQILLCMVMHLNCPPYLT